MGKRAARRQRSRQRQEIASRPERRRALIKKASMIGALAIVLLGIGSGSLLYIQSQATTPEQAASSSGLEIGSNIGNHVPEFDLRLVDGSTVNSATLVSADKPAFYFFFATW